MALNTNRLPAGTSERYRPGLFALLLFAVLAVLFARSFLPGICHFNNDMPLGAMKYWGEHWWSGFSGRWADLNTVGDSIGAATPTISVLFLGLVGPVGFAKFYAPFALMILGLGAYWFFQALKLSPMACLLGGFAGALSSDFLATACWGVASQPLAFGLSYMALAAIVSTSRPAWVRLPLAGLALGMGVAEVPDIIGFIFAPLVGLFVVYHALVSGEGVPVLKRLLVGFVKLAVVALFAGWMAIGVIEQIYITKVKSVAEFHGSDGADWAWATQWSLPKREVLNVAVPGLFGFRMDSSQHGLKGGDYWGAGGRDLAWDAYFANGSQGPEPGGFIRYGGGGLYAGVLVVVLGLWAAFQARRGAGPTFSPVNRKLLWFWLGVMVVSVLLSVGRYAPFFGCVYNMPGLHKLFSSYMRNPGKFMHPFEWGLVVLFAYGVDGLTRRYAQTATASSLGLVAHVRGWWSKVSGFDRKWTLGCLAALALSVLGWFIYASSRASLETYLQTVRFDADTARAIAGFSIEHVGWFVLRLALAVGLVTVALSGWFAGKRAKWGGIVLGLFLAGDLAIANQPWIIFWDYPQKYATNPVIDQLRERPYEGRAVILPSWMTSVFQASPQLAQAEAYLNQLYEIEWKQQVFQYYSIQTLDVVQMSRVPSDWGAYESTLEFINNARTGQPLSEIMHLVARRWQLTNTRYLLGAAPFLDVLNQALDPAQHRFRILTRFNIVPKPDVAQVTSLTELTAQPATNGNFALFEFTGALPRARLFTNWQVPEKNAAVVSQFITPGLSTNALEAVKAGGTNDFLTLKELASPSFDPLQTVLVADSPEYKLPTPATNAPAAGAGSVEFTSYAPKDIVLHAKAAAASVLLLNDKYDPGWKVWVDGKPETLLRCNYIMRGVQVPAGEHQVEFRFVPPVGTIHLSIAALAAAVGLLGSLFFLKTTAPVSAAATSASTEKAKA